MTNGMKEDKDYDKNVTKRVDDFEGGGYSTEITDTIKEVNDAMGKKTPTQVYVSKKEMSKLKSNRYEEKKHELRNEYVLQNNKTRTIVCLRGNSALQAINFIGWRPRHVSILGEEVSKA